MSFRVPVVHFISFLLIFGSYSSQLFAQERRTTEKFQYWAAYISAIKIHDKFSIWNDCHLVPTAFYLFRHGLSYHIQPHITITWGYAWLLLSTHPQNWEHRRLEHRPWGQINLNSPIYRGIMLTHRLRYDYRIRQSMEAGGRLTDNYTSFHRVRWMTGIRAPLIGDKLGNKIPFIAINNEVLLHFGEAIVWNYFDQNRLWFMLGYQWRQTTIQVGYMMRFVQGGVPGQTSLFHTPLFWITQTLDLRKKDEVNQLPPSGNQDP